MRHLDCARLERINALCAAKDWTEILVAPAHGEPWVISIVPRQTAEPCDGLLRDGVRHAAWRLDKRCAAIMHKKLEPKLRYTCEDSED